ncbi:MAG TPA: helix-hairpin-helix domain-containing protein [Polyangia bacterium]|nr:helix-hairpin-helix domain-containing protein [Polyangia bacterium]
MKTMSKILASTLLATMLSASLGASADETPASNQGVVNINTATTSELAYLPGIGPAMAEKIVQARSNKPFTRDDGITRIKGIGRKTFAKMRPFVTLEGPTTATKKIRIEK